MKRLFGIHGFTLIELLVVLAIIGVLASALTVSITKAGESARASHCKANLKNLAQAALSAANESSFHELPRAGSYDVLGVYRYYNTFRNMYWESFGWVGWTGRPTGLQMTAGNNAKTSTCFAQKQYYSMEDPAYLSISNGAVWSYVGGDVNTYVCEQHQKVCKTLNKYAIRSYVMNPYYGYARNGNQKGNPARRVSIGDLSKHGDASRLLMFAEMPCYKPNSRTVSVESSEQAADSVLQTKIVDSSYPCSPSTEEYIGFNHQIGKRYAAHVAFADGHVDVLAEPTSATQDDLLDLTESLCNGVEIDIDIQKRMH